MTVWTFKTSSDFGNELFLDIPLDGVNRLDDVEESLSGMELRSGTGCPDASVTESLNTIWQNMLKEKMQELGHSNRFDECLTVNVLGKFMGSEMKRDILSVVGYVFFNQTLPAFLMFARTELSVRPQLTLGRTVASQNKKESNLRVICFFYIQIPEWKFNSLFRDFCF